MWAAKDQIDYLVMYKEWRQFGEGYPSERIEGIEGQRAKDFGLKQIQLTDAPVRLAGSGRN
ncbi:MAG: hypothetical protein WAN65_06615 [Candidatus Sulfotelmatobacter sp.]